MTRLADWTAPVSAHRSVGPHRARRVGATVLVAGPSGRVARLSVDDYDRFLRGLPPADALRARLAPLGVLADAFDADALARELVETGLLNWRGPATHLLFVSRRGATMTPETAKDCVDLAFATPRPALTLELATDDAAAAGATLRFAARYAEKKAEWSRRGLTLVARVRGDAGGALAGFLSERGVALRVELDADGAPSPSALRPCARALVRVGPGARDPEAWVDLLAARGVGSVLFAPTARTAAHARRFVAFYAAALGRLLERWEDGPNDEWAAALLGGRAAERPGVDLLETLAYAPDGGVYSSEDGLALAEAGDATYALGPAARLRFEELAKAPLVRLIAAGSWRDVQPLCGDCAYRLLCTVPPSVHQIEQGSPWGRLPDSPRCIVHMGVLDALFSSWDAEKRLPALEKWGVDTARYSC
ncbi:MAG: hypothetical protein SF051_15035 [Elusimicrobiota bacterium]|nr:hypothetical protein [Elusimicrobiota bacterium]